MVEAREVTHAHRTGGRPVLDGVSFSAGRGEFVVVEGRSGSGKSTLCQLLARLEAPAGGTVLVDRDEAHRIHDWARIGLMPQRLGLAEELTVAENVWLPCWVRGLPERVVSLAGEGTTVVVASHDPQLRDVADQVVRLRAGVRRG